MRACRRTPLLIRYQKESYQASEADRSRLSAIRKERQIDPRYRPPCTRLPVRARPHAPAHAPGRPVQPRGEAIAPRVRHTPYPAHERAPAGCNARHTARVRLSAFKAPMRARAHRRAGRPPWGQGGGRMLDLPPRKYPKILDFGPDLIPDPRLRSYSATGVLPEGTSGHSRTARRRPAQASRAAFAAR